MRALRAQQCFRIRDVAFLLSVGCNLLDIVRDLLSSVAPPSVSGPNAVRELMFDPAVLSRPSRLRLADRRVWRHAPAVTSRCGSDAETCRNGVGRSPWGMGTRKGPGWVDCDSVSYPAVDDERCRVRASTRGVELVRCGTRRAAASAPPPLAHDFAQPRNSCAECPLVVKQTKRLATLFEW